MGIGRAPAITRARDNTGGPGHKQAQAAGHFRPCRGLTHTEPPHVLPREFRICRSHRTGLAAALLLAAGAIPVPAGASGSFSLPFDSVAAAGRGFAGLAADTTDPTALAINPAAIAWFDQASYAGGFHLAAYGTRFEGLARRAATDDSAVVGGDGGNPGRLDLPLPDLAAAVPIDSRWSAGLRVNVPYGITLRYDPNWTGRYHTVDTIIRGIEVAPAIAWRASERLSFGASLIGQQFVAEFSNDVDLGAVIQRQVEAEAGAGITSPACAIAGEPTLPGKYDFRNAFEIAQPGFGWQLGALWRFADGGAFGIGYRSAIRHRLRGDAERRRAGWTADELRNDPCLAPVELALTAQGRSFEDEVIQPALRSSSNTGFAARFTIPESIGAAIRVPVAGLNLHADLRWTRWSRIESIRFSFDNNAPSVTEPLRFRDSYRIALGADRALGERLVARFGIAWESSTVNDDTRTARAPDGDRRLFSLGAGYRLRENWTLDVAAGYLRSQARPVRDLADASGSGNRLDGRYEPLQLAHLSLRLVWTPGTD